MSQPRSYKRHVKTIRFGVTLRASLGLLRQQHPRVPETRVSRLETLLKDRLQPGGAS